MDLPVRDVELIFGYESPTRFYYVHLAGITNAVHNGIFLVADADRRRLDQPDSVPQMKDQAWHRVRLERDPASGRIEIFMDGSTTPVLKATDTTIAAGRIGFGSFDETGEFRNIVVTRRDEESGTRGFRAAVPDCRTAEQISNDPDSGLRLSGFQLPASARGFRGEFRRG